MGKASGDMSLLAFGRRVRARRESLGLSLRAVAGLAEISPSYLSAIESGRNPATGRPPEPSVGVADRLCRALDLTPVRMLGACAHDHALLYRLDDAHGGLAGLLDCAFGDTAEQWIRIDDPRDETADTALSWRWPYGGGPYPDDYLVPDRIFAALESRMETAAAHVTSTAYGLAIADCSAVMRWVVNPDAEVALEDIWADRAADVLTRCIGRGPVANVCVYRHADLEALSGRIDTLDAILRLVGAHTRTVAVTRSGAVLHGPDAVGAILAESRPGGVSANAWDRMVRAAAQGLAA